MRVSFLKKNEVLKSVGLFMFILGCYLFGLENRKSLLDHRNKLRESHVYMQELERQQFHLKNSENSQWLSNLEGGLTYLKIDIDEFMNKQGEGSKVTVIHYDMSDVEKHSDYSGEYSISTLRIRFDVSVAHALLLSEFYVNLVDAATPWLSEMRACEIDRQVPEGLRARCVFDIHYWKMT